MKSVTNQLPRHFLALFAIFFALLSPVLAQSVIGKVEPQYIIGEKNGKARQRLAASPTYQQLLSAAKAADVYSYSIAPRRGWQITDAISSIDGNHVIFSVMPLGMGGSGGSDSYVMVLSVPSRKLVALPDIALFGGSIKFLPSGNSRKAFFYINGREDYKLFAIDKGTFDYAEVILQNTSREMNIKAGKFTSPSTVSFSLVGKRYDGSKSRNSPKTVNISLSNIPSVIQVRQAIFHSETNLEKFGEKVHVKNVGVQNNWVICTIDVPNLDSAVVILKRDSKWRLVDIGTSFENFPEDFPRGMPAGLSGALAD